MKRNDACSGEELFSPDGHLTDTSFELLISEKLDPLQSLEVSEHLSFCDRCLERYTAVLSGEIPLQSQKQGVENPGSSPPKENDVIPVHLIEPPPSLLFHVMKQIQTKNRVFYFQKITSAAVAASLALVFWSSGVFSANRFFGNADRFLYGIQVSSQTLMERTNEISENINEFFNDFQTGLMQRRFSSQEKGN